MAHQVFKMIHDHHDAKGTDPATDYRSLRSLFQKGYIGKRSTVANVHEAAIDKHMPNLLHIIEASEEWEKEHVDYETNSNYSDTTEESKIEMAHELFKVIHDHHAAKGTNPTEDYQSLRSLFENGMLTKISTVEEAFKAADLSKSWHLYTLINGVLQNERDKYDEPDYKGTDFDAATYEATDDEETDDDEAGDEDATDKEGADNDTDKGDVPVTVEGLPMSVLYNAHTVHGAIRKLLENMKVLLPEIAQKSSSVFTLNGFDSAMNALDNTTFAADKYQFGLSFNDLKEAGNDLLILQRKAMVLQQLLDVCNGLMDKIGMDRENKPE